MHRDKEEHRWRKHSTGPRLTLRDESRGSEKDLYPCSPDRKRWILSAGKTSAVANALSIPPGEYARKSETQRN